MTDTLELISVDVIDTNKLNRDREALPTEDERLKFDDTWELGDYFVNCTGPFNDDKNADSFDDILPKGMDCSLPYGWAYWIVVRDKNDKEYEIESGSLDYPNGGRGSDIVTTKKVWSLSDCCKLIEETFRTLDTGKGWYLTYKLGNKENVFVYITDKQKTRCIGEVTRNELVERTREYIFIYGFEKARTLGAYALETLTGYIKYLIRKAQTEDIYRGHANNIFKDKGYDYVLAYIERDTKAEEFFEEMLGDIIKE